MPDLYRIGEFARLSGLTVKALRHYARIGLLTPERIDPRTGYRFYGAAPLVTVEEIRDLEVLEAKVISLDAAKAVAAAAEAFARGRQWSVAIAVVDVAGGPILLHRMDEAQHASADLALGKARTSARFKRPTKALADAVAQGRAGFLGVEGVVPLEGGVPLMVEGKVIGAVGVSGLTGAQDAEVALAGAQALRQ